MCKKKLFNINFYANRTTFQVQHNALKWMKNHKLFGILFKNERYLGPLNHSNSISHHQKYNFRYECKYYAINHLLS